MLKLKTDIEWKIREILQYLKDVQGTVDPYEKATCEGELQAYRDVIETIKKLERDR